MSTTITIIKSIEVDIELVQTDFGDALVANEVPRDYGRVNLARVYIEEADYEGERPNWRLDGDFVDNLAVEAAARAAVGDSSAVRFDSDGGEFRAYVDTFDAAVLLGRTVTTAAIRVALERGEL
jgi:hypothetical protein